MAVGGPRKPPPDPTTRGRTSSRVRRTRRSLLGRRNPGTSRRYLLGRSIGGHHHVSRNLSRTPRGGSSSMLNRPARSGRYLQDRSGRKLLSSCGFRNPRGCRSGPRDSPTSQHAGTHRLRLAIRPHPNCHGDQGSGCRDTRSGRSGGAMWQRPKEQRHLHLPRINTTSRPSSTGGRPSLRHFHVIAH